MLLLEYKCKIDNISVCIPGKAKSKSKIYFYGIEIDIIGSINILLDFWPSDKGKNKSSFFFIGGWLNCNDILSSFYKSEYPIIFKVKGTNYHAAVVKEIHRDVIRIGNEYCSYSKFIEFLHSKKN